MIKRYLLGNPTVTSMLEWNNFSSFLRCIIARVVWSVVASYCDINDIPCNPEQYWRCISKTLPNGRRVFTFGIASICLAIWNAKKLIKHSCAICSACSCTKYWVGLRDIGFKEASSRMQVSCSRQQQSRRWSTSLVIDHSST